MNEGRRGKGGLDRWLLFVMLVVVVVMMMKLLRLLLTKRTVSMELRWHLVAKPPRHVHHCTRMESIRRARHREGGSKSHTDPHTGRVKVACLIVIKGIHASWS